MRVKTSLEEFALLGGPSAYPAPLHVGRPSVPDRAALLERIEGVLDRRWLTNDGPLVQEFEAKVAELLGVRHCVAMCNGTVGLEIAIRALDLKGEVIVPSFTFVATAHALQFQEITPVFCDLDPETLTLDPERIEQHITPRTTGIIGVHLFGRSCDTARIEAIAERHGLPVLYDAAHSFACSHRSRMIGSFGAAEVLSFHATKFFNTLEGGAVTTNDDELAKKMRLMRNFGFSGWDRVTYVGTNGKMNEVSAAMGLTSLESLERFVERNRRHYHAYREALAQVPGVRLFEYDEREQCNYQYLLLLVDEAQTRLTRDQLIEVLHAEKILARRYFYPGVHRMEPYRSYFPHAGLLLPETERVAGQVLLLPTGAAIEEGDPERIVGLLADAIEAGEELRARMANGAG